MESATKWGEGGYRVTIEFSAGTSDAMLGGVRGIMGNVWQGGKQEV